jgi:pectate lyase
MKGRFLHLIVLDILLISRFSTCLAAKDSDPNESSKYLNAVREFADNVLKYGRDTYGPKHTPLFVDGLMVRDPNNPDYGKDGVFKPVEWIAPNGERWILSNLASQQNLFRTLDGLTAITGDPKYKKSAMDAIKYAFENLRSPNGLLYWGGYAAYDALGDEPCGGDLHVFKAFLPHYELMWQIDSEVTRQIIESLWASHIFNWSNLDMNRMGPLDRVSVSKGWEHEYKGGPVFFKSWNRSLATTGSDLCYATAILFKLSGQKEPLTWGKRLAHRYVETRDPKTGISAYVYTLNWNDSKHPLADDFKEHVVYEWTIFPPSIEQTLDPIVRQCKLGYYIISPSIPYSYASNPWICYLLIGELLGDEGREFTQWALEELTARGKVAYRKIDNVYIPILQDGTSLEGYAYKKDVIYGPKGTTFKPISALPMDFWGYTLAYRVTRDEFMWEMARNIARGNGLGDIGAVAEGSPKLQIPKDNFDPYTLLALLELYRKTEKTEFLQAAQKVGDNILFLRYHDGFFAPSSKHIYAKFDAIEALALLHLESALRGKGLSVPQVWPGRPLFTYPFRDKELVADNALIYTLTESPEPPRSLQEAAACGDIDELKGLITQGVDINGRESLRIHTALYRAVINGHKESVGLLLSKGAQVDAGDDGPTTTLCYATEKGYRGIAELLIAHGADVNVKRGGWPAGDTPLHSAVRGGYKDIIELLIANGADVNIKNNQGQTPLEIALINNRSDIVELLVAKGADVSLHTAVLIGDLAKVKSLIEEAADVNTKDASDNTPLHYAVQGRNRDLVEFLIASGADVNAKNNQGQTPLDIASTRRREDIVDLLIAKGATIQSIHVAVRVGDVEIVKAFLEQGIDVNAKDSYGITPLHHASAGDNRDIIELLLENGVDVNAKSKNGRTALHLAVGFGRKDIVGLLVEKGADVNTKDSQGQTPLQLAEKRKHTEIAELLRKHGAKEDKASEKIPSEKN